jgi:large subunit ribosomal protein L21
MHPTLLRTQARPSTITSSTVCRSLSSLPLSSLASPSSSPLTTSRLFSTVPEPAAAPAAAAPFHYLINHAAQYDAALSTAHGAQLSLLDDEKKPLIAGKPAGGSFAVLLLGGQQHKVTVDDVICSEKLLPLTRWEVGAELTLTDEVLACGSATETLLGVPSVQCAKVTVRVEEITHDATVTVFKKRRRKNSRRKIGCRRELTFLRVLDIQYDKE